MSKKNVKVRDLKPKKDAKGGGHTLAGGLHHPGGLSGAGPTHGASGAGPSRGASGAHGPNQGA
jgi:hypothetical protein